MPSKGLTTGALLVAGMLSASLLCGAAAGVSDFYDVAAVSSAPDRLDVVAVSKDGHVYYATWEPNSADWQGWWQVGGDAPVLFISTGVSLVSRSGGRLDVFAVGEDQHVYTASRGPGAASLGWEGWRQIGDLAVAFGGGTRVTAVSRPSGQLDIFTIGTDGYVYTASSEEASGGWRGWSRIGELRTDAGHSLWQPGEIAAISGTKDKLDVFAVGADRRVHTASWRQDSASWSSWRRIGDLPVAGDAEVAAVSCRADRIDIVVAPGAAGDSRGYAYTAGWEPGFKDWSSWLQIGDRWVRGVRAISRSSNRIDLFASERADGRLVTASWEEGIGSEQGWQGLSDLEVRSAVCLVSRSTGGLFLFFVGGDRNVYALAWEAGKGWGESRSVAGP